MVLQQKLLRQKYFSLSKWLARLSSGRSVLTFGKRPVRDYQENLAFVVVLVLACSKLRGSRVRRSEYPFLFLFSCPANFSRTFHFRVFPTILESGTGYPSLKI